MNPTETSPRALSLLTHKTPLVIAHRGYSQLAPENTLPAFDLALQAGADLVEMDYRVSRDGQPLVVHDADLDRTTDARRHWHRRRIKVSSKTAHEILELDAGNWFDPHTRDTRVPLLAEALRLVHGTPGGVALIERKSGEPEPLLELLRQLKMVNEVVVQAFDWTFLRALHRLEPRQVLAALGPPSLRAAGRHPAGMFRPLNAGWLRKVQTTGARVVVWNSRLSRKSIRLAHDCGLKVWVYTINNMGAAIRLLAMGVDGLITNNPALIWKVMALQRETPILDLGL